LTHSLFGPRYSVSVVSVAFEKTMRRVLSMLAFSSTALLGSAFAQTGGRDLYIAKCSACHGPDGAGNTTVGRSLKLSDIRPAIKSMTDEQLRQIILEGRGKMPPNKKFDDEKVRNLTLFLHDLAEGNLEAGRAVKEAQAQPVSKVNEVFRDKCSACHGRDGTGRTTIGKSLEIPDLTSPAVQSQSGEELGEVIRQGKGRMPGYAKKFNPAQVGQLVSYIRTLPKTGSEKAVTKSEESQASVAQPPPSPSNPIAPQPAAISPTSSPEGKTAPPNSSKETEKRKGEPKPAVAPVVKKAPLNGRQMYIAKCSACHSRDGSGIGTIGKSMKIPSLISPQVQDKSDEVLAEVISNGVGKMPAYKKKYSPEQIRLLIAYVRELGKMH
jgi:mono/diheme cytochrome c family protein